MCEKCSRKAGPQAGALAQCEICRRPRSAAAVDLRALRYRRRAEAHRRWSLEAAREHLERPRREYFCGHARAGSNDGAIRIVDGDSGRRAHLAGVQHCGSVWLCPTCAAMIRSQRADEVRRAVDVWESRGGEVIFLTLTLRHYAGDGLADALASLLSSWRSVTASRWWRGVRAGLGMRGYIRSLEVTHGAHGWHPHLHFALLVDGAVDADAVAGVGRELSARWARAVVAHGGRMPDDVHGAVMEIAGDAAAVATYCAKISDGLASEIARGDAKVGRGASVTPFELLDSRDAGSSRLWFEYARAMKGRAAILFSRGLKKELGIDEKTDADIVDELERAGEVVARVDAPTCADAARKGVMGEVLAAVESGAAWEHVASLLDAELEVVEVLDPATGEIVTVPRFYHRE